MYPTQMPYPMPMPIPYQQYTNAYPTIPYQQPPSAANGYGWHGNGYGWQRDPTTWKNTSVDEVESNEVSVEEPLIQVAKVKKVESFDFYPSGYQMCCCFPCCTPCCPPPCCPPAPQPTGRKNPDVMFFGVCKDYDAILKKKNRKKGGAGAGGASAGGGKGGKGAGGGSAGGELDEGAGGKGGGGKGAGGKGAGGGGNGAGGGGNGAGNGGKGAGGGGKGAGGGGGTEAGGGAGSGEAGGGGGKGAGGAGAGAGGGAGGGAGAGGGNGVGGVGAGGGGGGFGDICTPKITCSCGSVIVATANVCGDEPRGLELCNACCRFRAKPPKTCTQTVPTCPAVTCPRLAGGRDDTLKMQMTPFAMNPYNAGQTVLCRMNGNNYFIARIQIENQIPTDVLMKFPPKIKTIPPPAIAPPPQSIFALPKSFDAPIELTNNVAKTLMRFDDHSSPGYWYTYIGS